MGEVDDTGTLEGHHDTSGKHGEEATHAETHQCICECVTHAFSSQSPRST